MIKSIILIFLFSVIAIAAAGYGLSKIENPFEAKDRKQDELRVSHISEIKYQISSFKTKERRLPDSLQELTDKNKSSRNFPIIDPDTKKPYDYSKKGIDTYQLCAEFKTSNMLASPSPTQLLTGNSSYFHPAGYHCFDLTGSLSSSYTPTSNKKPGIISTEPDNSSGSAVRSDPTIQYVVTTTGGVFKSITAEDSKYSAKSNFPNGFFSADPNEWGLLTSANPAQVSVRYNRPVRFKRVTADLSPGCGDAPCIEWKAEGLTEDGFKKPLFSGYAGKEGSPTVVTIDSQEKYPSIMFTASVMSHHKVGYLYWRKLNIEYE